MLNDIILISFWETKYFGFPTVHFFNFILFMGVLGMLRLSSATWAGLKISEGTGRFASEWKK